MSVRRQRELLSLLASLPKGRERAKACGIVSAVPAHCPTIMLDTCSTWLLSASMRDHPSQLRPAHKAGMRSA